MTVLTGQALVYAACEPLRVFPSVAKEDLWSAKLRCLDPAFPRRPGARLLYGLMLSSDCRALGFLASLFLPLGDSPVQHAKQPLDINIEPARAELNCLLARQLGQARRQLIGAGHPGPFDQDGDDADITRQSSFELQPDEVVAIIQPPLPVLAGDREPPVADQCQQHVAGSDRGGDHIDEVVVQFDRGVDVLEDMASAEVPGEPVVQPGGGVAGVFAAVAHEDPARNVTGGRSHDLGPRGFPTLSRLTDSHSPKAACHAPHATGACQVGADP